MSPRWHVDRHGLGEDPVEADAAAAITDKLARALGGVAAAPVPAQQPEAKVGLAGDVWLIWAVRRLQDPPAYEVAAVDNDAPYVWTPTAAGWWGRHPGHCPVSDYERLGRIMRRSRPDLRKTTISAMSSRAMTAGVIVPAQSKPDTVAG